ncbi:hypothetical protein PFTANZ_00699, partial [Plasmodium falciparum Tanzania (2000708)]
MGNTPSTLSVPKDVKYESSNSARNVLEKIGKVIKDKASEDARKYINFLKGNLKSAKFHHEFSKYSDVPHNPCGLDFAYHSNTSGGFRKYRHPCYGRQTKHNSKLEGSVCTNSKIKGNEEKINGAGACAPYRRRHMCDLNLEHIDVYNVQNIDDLLGNVLVTAKYEGESIVEKHPNRGSSEVCTALARSFADIGDIVRGTDMFKPNKDDKVEKGLRAIFKNIYEGLKGEEVKVHYKENKDGNYYKLREDWWTANRDQVWKALTCSAPGDAKYVKYFPSNTTTVSSNKCGHNDMDVPTNLDYVPQFLRWFDEWAEEFCRIRKIKIDKTKEECIGENNGKNCSREGYDCNKTNLKLNEIFVDLDCPRCEKACT